MSRPDLFLNTAYLSNEGASVKEARPADLPDKYQASSVTVNNVTLADSIYNRRERSENQRETSAVAVACVGHGRIGFVGHECYANGLTCSFLLHLCCLDGS